MKAYKDSNGLANLTAAEQIEFAKQLRALNNFKFGEYLKGRIGSAPKGMGNAHGHHVVFKNGLGIEQKMEVAKAFAILTKHKIDPIKGLANLDWARNKIPGQHDITALRKVVNALEKAHRGGKGSKQDILDTLQRLKAVARSRK